MSDSPDKKHPWAKFRPAPGGVPAPRATPPRTPPPPAAAPVKPPTPIAKPATPMAKPGPLVPPATGGGPTPPPVTGKTPEAGTVVSDDLAAALNKLAAEYAAPAVTSAPFISAMQREVDAREKKRATRRQFTKLAIVGLVSLVALHFTITRLVYNTPSLAALEGHVETLPELVLPLYSTVRQPLRPGTVTFSETDRVGANRIRYAAEVTLVLRQPLYLPASTNGTEAYKQLQLSLFTARERELKFNLFPPGEGPPLPVLPRLIQMSHRTGEPVVIRIPFEARRVAWAWRLEPPILGLRTANRSFVGDTVDAYADAPYLIFGAGAMNDLRQMMRDARTYIIAVTQEIQKRADVQAVVNKAEKADPGAAPADAPALDPNKPALSLEELRKLFDPNAPAVPDADKPARGKAAVDPDAPAIDGIAKPAEPDPDAPAIKFDPNAKAVPQKKRP